MICKHCKIEMKIGIAIEENCPENALPVTGVGCWTADHLPVINVYKCPSCGHSEHMKEILRSSDYDIDFEDIRRYYSGAFRYDKW